MSKKSRPVKLVIEPVAAPVVFEPVVVTEPREESSGAAPPEAPTLSKHFVLCRESRAVIPRRFAFGRFKTATAVCRVARTLDRFVARLGREGYVLSDAEIEGYGPVLLYAKGNVGVLFDVSDGGDDGWDFGGGVLKNSNAVAVTLGEDARDEDLAAALRLPLVRNVMPRLAGICERGPRGADVWLLEPGFRWTGGGRSGSGERAGRSS